MYKTCPKCGHERTAQDAGSEEICPACGLIYAKYLKQRYAPPEPVAEAPDPGIALADTLLAASDDESPLTLWARTALFAGLAIYGVKLARMDVPSWEMASSLIHLPMVPLHEFGHLFFMAFGEFMHLLGGSLFQAGLPLVFGIIFLAKRDAFAASVMLWWSAVAVMDIAPYVYDAQQPVHVLLTGRTGETGAHDFIDVLGDLGLLKQAQAVGYAVHKAGIAMLVLALAWGGAVLLRAWRERAS